MGLPHISKNYFEIKIYVILTILNSFLFSVGYNTVSNYYVALDRVILKVDINIVII